MTWRVQPDGRYEWPPHWPYDATVSDAAALPHACPLCGAVPGAPCTRHVQPGARAREERAGRRHGDVLSRPHVQRRVQAAWALHRRREREAREARDAEVARQLEATRPLREAAAVMRQRDLREHEQLRAWLAAHGALLTRPGSPAAAP